MKKALIVMLVALIALSAVFASGGGETPAETTKKPGEKIIVNFWHSMAVGVNGDTVDAAVKRFNETIGEQEGIEVIATYQGVYNDNMSKVLSAIAAGAEIPQVVQGERSNNIPIYWDEGVLVDLTDYVKNSKLVDMDNFIPALTGFSYSPTGEIISFPYSRSSFLLYYNKGMFKEAGLGEPESFADIEAAAKKLTTADVSGYCFWHDFSPEYAVVSEMGSEIFSDGGAFPALLTDGTLLDLLTWWKKAVDDGWMSKYPSTNTAATLATDLMNGRLGAFIQSTGNLGAYIKAAKEAGIELGVTAFPAWYNGKRSAPIGGGNIVMIGASNTKEQRDAAWKFMEFLVQDEQVIEMNQKTGYLITTKSAVNSQAVKDYWAANPEFKIAYDSVLQYGVELPFSLYKPNFSGILKAPISTLIVEGKITPQEAVQQIYDESKKVFPNM